MNAVLVYEQEGFLGKEETRFEFPEKHFNRSKPRLLFVRRPAKGGGSQEIRGEATASHNHRRN